MYYLGIDIGGTSVKIGLLTDTGRILDKETYSVNFDHYETPLLKTVLHSTESFLSKNKTLSSHLLGIGISATGQIDKHSGTVIGTAGHIKNWVHSPVRQCFTDKYRVPVSVINDADSVAMAEQWVGNAKGYSNAIIITVGTGIGGGIIVDSCILEGSRGIAGELGHITVHKEGLPCTCGNRGCYECYASVSAFIRMARDRYGQIPFSCSREEINGKELFRLLAEGDPVICEIADSWTSDIAAGLVSLTHIFNPEIILLGGGVSAQKALFIDVVRKKVLSRVMPCFREHLVIEAAALNNDAGMIGAVRPLIFH